ncbi:MAG: tetratricopeptide repeat protein [Verrucomicrobiae bacterium]|nr:tetratricopeptide repeat protein [Verrucomicrobiae bacterium]
MTPSSTVGAPPHRAGKAGAGEPVFCAACGARPAALTRCRLHYTVWPMLRRTIQFLVAALCVFAFVERAPAPLIYQPGEGWVYEPVGADGKWRRARAKDQLEVAQQAFASGDYNLALRAARRVVAQWPLSDYAPDAQFLIGQCYEAKKQYERAFRAYQKLIEKYPKSQHCEEALQRQFQIAERFLGGAWFKLWGRIPFFPSMSKTAAMFQQIVSNGAYSAVGPAAQLKTGAAHEKRKDYVAAVKAYEVAIDRYFDRPEIAAEALYRAGLAYYKQALKAEYDQTAAGKAIAALTDFIALYPNDPRVNEAQRIIGELRAEQARGSFEIAQYYERHRKYDGALIYYNEVLLQAPASKHAEEARKRIDALLKLKRPEAK